MVNAATQTIRLRPIVLATIVLAALVSIFLLGPSGAVPQAHAQTAAACRQYQHCKPPPPHCTHNCNNVGPKHGQGAAGPPSAAGQLPFTGYPLTPLLLLLLLPVASGLIIRVDLAARDRMRARHAGSSGGPYKLG